ncbi:hypothetical protein PIB30_016594 [Stylosanthes scabra]|uniref:Uncharacterized protein n=1 Tax=Stylosanthes scabra TaxID=79078 RepID=A0ABU6T748_9FABA|nr:hypothetical protein [Stylosanthes scabra]
MVFRAHPKGEVDLGSHAFDQSWLSRKIEKRLEIHSHMSKKEAQAFLKEDFNVTPPEKMVYGALRLARERLVGSEKE